MIIDSHCHLNYLQKEGQPTLHEIVAEAKAKGVMGFSRLEDIDWRRGSAENNREIYFCVTGRKKDGLVDNIVEDLSKFMNDNACAFKWSNG